MSKIKTNQKIYLKDYQESNYLLPQTDLQFNLSASHTKVTAKLHLIKKAIKVDDQKNLDKNNSKNPQLFLNGEKLELLSIKIDGQTLIKNKDYELSDEGLTIFHPPSDFFLETDVIIYPNQNTSLEGLYQSGEIICTQNEPEGFRKITYFLDRSDVLSRYRVNIIADKKTYPVLLSNGNLISEKLLEDGLHQAIFEDPFPKPSYLFALVAGKLDALKKVYTTASGKKINLIFYSETGKIDRCQHALKSLILAMKWDEAVYGLECDLNDYKVVAIDAFNFGAMENKGLNIFNSKLVLADEKTATDEDYFRIESVIAHEYFHNWTGNRVTLRDWFQLTLKEGLTVYRDRCFSADHHSPLVQRIKDVSYLRSFQFKEDNGPLSHPLQPQFYESINNFYTLTTYEKGAEIIGMYETLLLKKKFIAGVRQYLKANDGKAATIEDFFNSMQSMTPADLSQFKKWYHTQGTPIVKVDSYYLEEKQEYHITLEQSFENYPQQPTLLIPLHFELLYGNGELIKKELWKLSKKRESKTFIGIKKKPFLSINQYFSAPVKLIRNLNLDEWLEQLQLKKDAFDCWDILQQLYLLLFDEFNADTSFVLDNYITKIIEVFKEIFNQVKSPFKASSFGDPAYLAQLLTFPSTINLMARNKQIDFIKIKKFTEQFSKKLITGLVEDLLFIYQSLENKATPEERAFKNKSLKLLVKFNSSWQGLAVEQFYKAKNLTDELNAFEAILYHQGEIREKAIHDFYQKWKTDNLVINKWFTSLASIDEEDTLVKISQLEKTPEFNIKEPNKCHALWTNFIINNPFIFHHNSGKGYQLIADKIIILDKINPQTAARVLSYWEEDEKLISPQKEKLNEQLKKISQSISSKEVIEILNKKI